MTTSGTTVRTADNRERTAYRSALEGVARRFLVDEVQKKTPLWLREAIAEIADQYEVAGDRVFDDMVRAVFRGWWGLPIHTLVRDAADKLTRVTRIAGHYVWQRIYANGRPPPGTFPPAEAQPCHVPTGPADGKVSIVVLSYNRLSYLKSTLASLYATAGYENFEVIVVDNGSTDGSTDYLKLLWHQKRIDKLILSPRNLGTSGGYNLGFSYADRNSGFLAKLDSDIVLLTRGWLCALISQFESDPAVGLVALSVINNSGIRSLPVLERQGNRVKPMWFGIMGAAGFTFRRRLFEELGYFNENFDYPYILDDVDYVYRVIASGYDAYYLSDYHAFERRDLNRSSFFDYERSKKFRFPRDLIKGYFGGTKQCRISYPRYEANRVGSEPLLVELESGEVGPEMVHCGT